MTKTILIVDDELDMLQLLKRSLEKDMDCHVEVASSGEMALERLDRNAIDLVVTDIRMSGMSGLDLLQQVKMAYPDLTVVMMTAFGHIDMAVEAMRQGAYDFITKPFDHDALVLRLEKALERSRLVKENLRLQRECRDNDAFGNLVGSSTAMQKVFDTLQMVAQTEMTVLITGESGTGKELAARAVHMLSPRNAGPFVAVNCPTLPENILEIEVKKATKTLGIAPECLHILDYPVRHFPDEPNGFLVQQWMQRFLNADLFGLAVFSDGKTNDDRT